MTAPAATGPRTAARRVEVGRLLIEVVTGPLWAGLQTDGIEANGEPAYLLAIPLNGSLSYSQNSRQGTVERGGYVLLSRDSFHDLHCDSPVLLTLHVPASDLKGRLAFVDDHLAGRFSPNEAMTQLFVDLITRVAELFSEQAPPNPEALATEIVSFLALVIGSEDRGSTSDVRNARYHLRRRIFDFIEANLGDSELTPRRIAASNRISVSYLYSLFSDDDTTVSHFLLTRRLQRAYELLVADQNGHRTIAEVAYEVGFKNVSHFSKSFSRHFQVAPSRFRRSGRILPAMPRLRGAPGDPLAHAEHWTPAILQAR